MFEYTEDKIKELDQYFLPSKDLVSFFEESVNKFPSNRLFGVKNLKTKQYEWFTYSQVAKRVDNLRSGISQLGFNVGESIGVIISNSLEWFVCEQACHGLGGRFVPMYERELEKIWKYIIRDSSIKYLFVRDFTIYEKVKNYIDEINSLKDIFVIYGDGEKTMRALEKLGMQKPIQSYKPHWSEISNIIYTSGTTGKPKGVLLTHGNMRHCCQVGCKLFTDLDETSVSLSILPWAHSYAVNAEVHGFIQFGGSIGIMESIHTLADDLLAVKPTHLVVVPKVFNQIYNGIQTKMQEIGGLKKILFNTACAEAKRVRDTDKKSLKLKILDRLVFSKIRDRFGGRLKSAMTASAVMNPDIARFFNDIGLPIYDCYGLTETSPAITMNSPILGNKYGSVGRPVQDMHVEIDKSRVGKESNDGEIIAYGAHVMVGYHNKPDKTREIMLENTWKGFPGIRTGDLGRLDDEGFLFITGRWKDEYKLTNGKYVHPEPIERDIKLIYYVANAFIFGDGQAYNVALIVPNFEILETKSSLSQWSLLSPSEVIEDESYKAYISSTIINSLRKSYGGYEVPKKFLFIKDDFTLENGMLTQTMKLKRREIMRLYGEKLLKLYSQ